MACCVVEVDDFLAAKVKVVDPVEVSLNLREVTNRTAGCHRELLNRTDQSGTARARQQSGATNRTVRNLSRLIHRSETRLRHRSEARLRQEAPATVNVVDQVAVALDKSIVGYPAAETALVDVVYLIAVADDGGFAHVDVKHLSRSG